MGDIVVDTNVLAYALFGEPEMGVASLEALRSCEEIVVPDLVRAELANVLWQWARAGRASEETAQAILFDAEGLLGEVVSASRLWNDAFALALAKDHPVYDTIFVALAGQRDLPLLSWDGALRRRFPEVVMTPRAYLESRA